MLGFALYVATWFYQDSRNIQYDFLRFQGWIYPDTWVPYLDTPLKRFWYQFSNQEWRHAFFALPLAKVQSNAAAYFAELPSLFSAPGLALAAVGVVGTVARRPQVGLALLLVFATQIAFWLSYDISDLAKHLLPSYLIMSLWIGLGVAAILDLVSLAWRRLNLESNGRPRGALGGGLATLVVVLALGWLALLPNGSTAWAIALGQEPVDYQTTLSYHVPRNLAESETVARQTVSALPRNAVIFTEWREHFTLGYVAEFQLDRHDILMPRTTHFAREELIRVYTAQGRTIVYQTAGQRGLPPAGGQPGLPGARPPGPANPPTGARGD